MSYLSPLSSCSSPGWNDPPTVIDHSKKTSSSGSGALINKHRRPVHPSIQASSNQVVLSNSLQPVFSPQTPLSTFNPTLVSFAPSGQGTPNAVINSQPMASVPVPNHTCVDSFIPYSPSVSAETKKVALDESLYPQQQKHRSVFDAFTITGNKDPQRIVQPGSEFSGSYSSPSLAHKAPPIEENPNALISIPPNAITENSKRPATSPFPSDFKAPIKAVGDVSLNGWQLVQFLIKATYRLPAGVTRDGIQLRINQLNELTSSGKVTDGCIKKLNFVVDALDRGLFEEAHQFFEQLLISFPTETRSSWAQGIRLLLNELKLPTRTASAGLGRHK